MIATQANPDRLTYFEIWSLPAKRMGRARTPSKSVLIPLRNVAGLLAPSAADDFLLRSRRSVSISDRRLQPPSSRKELNRLRARAWQETMAEIPTASQEDEPSRLR